MTLSYCLPDCKYVIRQDNLYLQKSTLCYWPTEAHEIIGTYLVTQYMEPNNLECSNINKDSSDLPNSLVLKPEQHLFSLKYQAGFVHASTWITSTFSYFCIHVPNG